MAEEKFLGRNLSTAGELAGIGFVNAGRDDGAAYLADGSDWHRVISWTEAVSYGPDESVSYQAWLADRTRTLLSDEFAWAQVGAVAGTLAQEKRISGRRYRELRETATQAMFRRFTAGVTAGLASAN
jgi:hypothetical protein